MHETPLRLALAETQATLTFHKLGELTFCPLFPGSVGPEPTPQVCLLVWMMRG